MSEMTPLAENLVKLQRIAFRVGIAGCALLVLGFFLDRQQFFQSYLIGYVYWLGPALGSLAIVMLHNMTGGAWGFAVRRLLEAGMRTIPVMAILFVPLLFGIHDLYEWSHEDAVAADPILQHKSVYLNTGFFIGRSIAFFALWTSFALVMLRMAARYDRTLKVSALRGLKVASGVGLVVYVLTMSFASFDWAMSLEPHWFSTIYGIHFVVGQVLSTLCLAIVVASRLARHEHFSRWLEKGHFHDLGNLLMAFVMLWAYISFSQFLIVWSGNLPEETPWYLHRLGHGWQALALLLVVTHFAVPFLVLLSRRTKRNPNLLARVAFGILVLRFVDYYWLIAPAYNHGTDGGMHVSWMDVVCPVALGGIWLGLFLRNMRGRPLVSLQDAKLLRQLEEVPTS